MTTTEKTGRPTESKRIKQFRLLIAKLIPKFPNGRETLAVLEAKPLGLLLIDYVNWACRLIPPRPRKVTIEPTLTADPRWKNLGSDAKALLRRVSKGDNLAPALSLRALHNGFTPATSSAAPLTDKWADKDFLLITMGYHHLHLSQQTEPSGYSKRTNDVLFAHVTRERFNAIGFFDHSVFERSDPALQAMTAERKRLWQVFEQRNSFGQKPGAVYLVNPIATSGHSLSHARLAAEFSNIVYSIDHRLDNVAERSKIFSTVPHDSVKAMKLQWHFDYLDFRLFDKTSSNFFVLKYGLL